MAVFGNLTLNTKVYVPSYFRVDVAGWYNRDAGVAAGFSLLTQRVYTSPSQGGQPGATRSVSRMVVPIVSETDSACSCAGTKLRESGWDLTGWFAPGSTEDERTDLYLRLKDYVASDAFKETFTKLTSVH